MPRTAWFLAARSGSLSVMKRLFVKGLDVNLKNSHDNTALHAAVHAGRREVVDWLLSQGANPNLMNEDRISPLLLAARYKDEQMVARLIDCGADPNFIGIYLESLLTGELNDKNLGTVEVLLKNGANPNCPNGFGTRPLHVAVSRKQPRVLKLLLDYGAKMDLPGNRNNEPLLMHAVENGDKACLRVLLDAGVPLDLQDSGGMTAVYEAAVTHKTEMLEMLLAAGANPDLPDEEGNTPLHFAVQRNFPLVVDLLARHGADVNAVNLRGESVLYKALLNQNPTMLDILHSRGVKPETLSVSQQLALYLNDPKAFLDHFSRYSDGLQNDVLMDIYNAVEFNLPKETGLKLLPELMAMLGPYRRKNWFGTDLGHSTAALTRLFDYIQGPEDRRVGQVFGVTFNNWAKLGTLGLSFSRWKFDAMQRWKAAGPMSQPSLLEQSGLFKAIGPRRDDKIYHRGFLHYDPGTGLSIEMRRAYIAISKPGLGTLVIRNSSHQFGRDLLPMPAYYGAMKVYGDGMDRVEPEDVLGGNGFLHVLNKTLNHAEGQQENQEQISALLEAFDQVMSKYVAWKCDFKNGIPPQGFVEILKTALMSAKGDGASSPFGKIKNLRLAWVNPYALPSPVETYDLTTPAHQQEAALYLDVLSKRKQVQTSQEYHQKMPELIAFLNKGLLRGLELTLVE